jgi:hypothetical protein
MSDPLRLRALGEHAERVRDRLTALTGAELVEDLDRAELVVMTPEDLAELIEDAAATAAYHRTRNQERVPISRPADRRRKPDPGLARISRSFAAQLAEQAGVGIGYLSQIENGERKGTELTLEKIATALDVDIDDLT